MNTLVTGWSRRAGRCRDPPIQDLTGLGYLISAATEADLREAMAAVATIQERGFNRGQNLPEDLSGIIGQARK